MFIGAALLLGALLMVIFPNPNKSFPQDIFVVRFNYQGQNYHVAFRGNSGYCAYYLFNRARKPNRSAFDVHNSITVDNYLIRMSDVSNIEFLKVSLEGQDTCDNPAGSSVKEPKVPLQRSQ